MPNQLRRLRLGQLAMAVGEALAGAAGPGAKTVRGAAAAAVVAVLVSPALAERVAGGCATGALRPVCSGAL